MNQEQIELIEEILECQNCIMITEFKEKDIKILRELEKEGLVVLVWSVTQKGKTEYNRNKS